MLKQNVIIIHIDYKYKNYTIEVFSFNYVFQRTYMCMCVCVSFVLQKHSRLMCSHLSSVVCILKYYQKNHYEAMLIFFKLLSFILPYRQLAITYFIFNFIFYL
jgi:hypothetical protein